MVPEEELADWLKQWLRKIVQALDLGEDPSILLKSLLLSFVALLWLFPDPLHPTLLRVRQMGSLLGQANVWQLAEVAV